MRVSHEQNLILPHVALDDLPAVYDRLASVGLATPNAGQVSDIIACPGLDYCSLATARSIPVAQRIAERFGDGARARDIGPLKIKISGCINACGHHHVGHIGILGLERAGEETYQITLGGSGDETASIGQITGPGFSYERVVEAIETVVETYKAQRASADEPFLTDLSPRRHGAVQGGALRAERRIGHLMSAHDVKLFGDAIAASRLETRFAQLPAQALLRLAIKDLYPGRIALVSSLRRGFGGAAAYGRRRSTRRRRSCSSTPASISPRRWPIATAGRAARLDQHRRGRARTRRRWRARTPRSSCSPPIPTAAAKSARSRRWRQALDAYDAWITGRKGFQTADRSRLPLFEAEGERVKVNPLVGWSASDLLAYIKEHDLPPHPLVAKGFPSIGCLPCTSRVAAGRRPARGPLARQGQAGMRHPRRRRSTREETSDGAVARRRFRRGRLDDGRRRRCRPPTGKAIVSLARWRREADALARRARSAWRSTPARTRRRRWRRSRTGRWWR